MGSTASGPGAVEPVRDWKTNTGLILGWQVAASICFYTVYVIPTFVQDDFGVSTTLVGFMLTAMMLGYTAFLVPVGAITDLHGESRMLTLGLVGLAGSVVAITLAPSYLVVLATVFVLGAFYATAMPGTNKAVFNAIPHDRLNTAMGIKQVGVTAGSGISAIVVPWFAATRWGWQGGLVATGLFAIVVSAVFWIVYRDGGSGSDGDRGGITAHFSNLPYVVLTASGFFLGAGLFTMIGYTILFLEESVGAGVFFAGVALAGAQVFGSAGRVIFGWLADRLSGPLTTATLRILVLQAGASVPLFLAVTVVDSPIVALVLFCALGFFILGFTGVYYSCIGSIVDAEEMGSATAGGQIALNSGALLAPPTFGFLVDTLHYRAAWTMLAAGAFVAFLLLVSLLRRY